MKLCHRGITDYYPENTLGSIAETIQSNRYDGIEIDIQLTKDDEWILYHDYSLLRLNNIDASANNINFNEISMIRWKGNNFNITKLSDLESLQVPKNFIFDIEIKTKTNISNKAKNLLKNILSNLPFKKFISSFEYGWCNWVLENTNLEFAHIAEDKLPNSGSFWIISKYLFDNLEIFDIMEKNICLGIYGDASLDKLDVCTELVKFKIIDDKKDKIVYADGTFDLFHTGHIEFLKKAKLFGTKLYVGVLADESVESYKRTPILNLKERTEILKNIKIIDKVISPAPFHGSRFGNLDRDFLQKNEIDIVVYSGDLGDWMDHYKDAIDMGMIKNFDYGKDNLSTTQIINKIKNS